MGQQIARLSNLRRFYPQRLPALPSPLANMRNKGYFAKVSSICAESMRRVSVKYSPYQPDQTMKPKPIKEAVANSEFLKAIGTIRAMMVARHQRAEKGKAS